MKLVVSKETSSFPSHCIPDHERGTHTWKRTCFRLGSKGCATCPFHSGPIPSPPPIPFVFISSEPVVICCDKAASTGGARVSRVEGHTASVRRLLRGLVGLEERAEELWYICNHVTRYVPFRYNCSPVTNCLRTFFFTLWPRARTYNTSRRRTEWESWLEFLRVPVYLRVRKVGLFVNVKICTRREIAWESFALLFYWGRLEMYRSWFLRIRFI